jgi:hypothetical protein
MKRRRALPEDPVVAEVRAARRRRPKKAGETVDALLVLLDWTIPRPRKQTGPQAGSQGLTGTGDGNMPGMVSRNARRGQAP